MRMNKSHIRISGVLVSAALLLSALVWARVPSPMPVHFGADGMADGFANKTTGLLMLPLIMVAITALMAVVARLAKLAEENTHALGLITVATNAFMLGMHALVIHAAIGGSGGLSLAGLFILMGGLWIALGRIMPMLTQNTIAGIRTPWSLANEANWTVTHRFASKSFVVGGVVCILASLVLSGTTLFGVAFSAMMLGALTPVAASYALHRAKS